MDQDVQDEFNALRAQITQLTALLNTTAQNAIAANQAAAAAETRAVAAETAAQGQAPAKVSKRVDVVPDPGTFDGSYTRFDEWWCKMSTYLACNDDCFPTTKESTLAVLTRIGSTKEKDSNGALRWCRNCLGPLLLWEDGEPGSILAPRGFQYRGKKCWAMI